MADGTLPVPLPHLGVSVEEATVVAWHKRPGDAVVEGEALCDVATDKVDTEVASPADGVLAEILAAAGDTIPAGGLLARLAVTGAVGASAPPPSPAPAPPAIPAPGRFDPAAAAERVVADAVVRRDGGRVSSPVARRVAAEHGIDLASVAGTGLRGRIGKADVLAAVAAGAGAAAAAPAAAGLPRGYDDVPHVVVPTTRHRRVTAEHLLRSRQTAAHMTTEAEVDMSAAARARAHLNAQPAVAAEGRLTYLALVARAACTALGAFPELNATFRTDDVVLWKEVNLGIAVDTDDGLLVPVIRGCERLTAPAIALAVAGLASRARARRLTPDDLRGGTFTLSNPGSAGGDSAMAIINQPQVAILGTPRIARRPVVVTDEHGDEAIAIRPTMTLTLTFDHRAVDGAQATRCVVHMRELLESWGPDDYA